MILRFFTDSSWRYSQDNLLFIGETSGRTKGGDGALPGSQIELRHIRYVVAAAEFGSFRRAAAALRIQESAISRRIGDLEVRLGVALFVRTSGGVQMTSAGRQFVERGRKALSEINIARSEVSAISRVEDGQLTIGILSSLGSPFLGNLIQAYRQHHGAVRMTFIDGNQTDHGAAIRLRQLDVAFVTGTALWPGCETEELWSEGVFVALPGDHALAERAALDWSDLVAERFIVSHCVPGPEIHDYLVQHLSGLGQHPEIHEHNVGRHNLLSLVALGEGLTLASEGVTTIQVPGVVFRPVADEALPYSMVWSAQNDNPALRSLLVLAREMSQTEYAGQGSFMFGAPDLSDEPLQNPDPSR